MSLQTHADKPEFWGKRAITCKIYWRNWGVSKPFITPKCQTLTLKKDMRMNRFPDRTCWESRELITSPGIAFTSPYTSPTCCTFTKSIAIDLTTIRTKWVTVYLSIKHHSPSCVCAMNLGNDFCAPRASENTIRRMKIFDYNFFHIWMQYKAIMGPVTVFQ